MIPLLHDPLTVNYTIPETIP